MFFVDWYLFSFILLFIYVILFLQLLFLLIAVWLFCRCWFISTQGVEDSIRYYRINMQRFGIGRSREQNLLRKPKNLLNNFN